MAILSCSMLARPRPFALERWLYSILSPFFGGCISTDSWICIVRSDHASTTSQIQELSPECVSRTYSSQTPQSSSNIPARAAHRTTRIGLLFPLLACLRCPSFTSNLQLLKHKARTHPTAPLPVLSQPTHPPPSLSPSPCWLP